MIIQLRSSGGSVEDTMSERFFASLVQKASKPIEHVYLHIEWINLGSLFSFFSAFILTGLSCNSDNLIMEKQDGYNDNGLVRDTNRLTFSDKMKFASSGMTAFEISEPKGQKKISKCCTWTALIMYLVMLTGGLGLLAYQVFFKIPRDINSVRQVNSSPSQEKLLGHFDNDTVQRPALFETNTQREENCISTLKEEIHLIKMSNQQLQWKMANITGLKGERGVPGPQGAQGHKGDKGDPGLRGSKGEPGPKGTGFPGQKGENGIPGIAGPPGARGEKGETGSVGPKGSKGNTGESGAPGVPGEKGLKGNLGPAGPKGEPGIKGQIGDKGDQGSQGIQGEVGAKGDMGPRGPMGATGERGEKGEQGPRGVEGPSGMPGATGEKGVSGSDGLPGSPGPKGAQGEKGQKGTASIVPGPRGEKGNQGQKGSKGDQGSPGIQGQKGERGIRVRPNENIRLAGGYNYRGRVEIRHKGEWGTICDDSWDINDGMVICRMLGFHHARDTFTATAGSGTIWLDDVACTGSEETILNCGKTDWGEHNCNHNEDAGVECS